MHLPPPTNHVFVDFENICEIDPAVLENKNWTFTILLGAAQKKLDVALVEKLLLHAASVRLIRLTSSGKNALDFTLAYYLGQAVAADPTGSFHIISADKGYDPLVQHLQSKRCYVRRHSALAEIIPPIHLKPPAAIPIGNQNQPSLPAKPKPQPQPDRKPRPASEDLHMQALTHLSKTSAARPRTVKTLTRSLKARFDLTQDAVDLLVQDLSETGRITIDTKTNVVTYQLGSTSTSHAAKQVDLSLGCS
jgi:hypothetical protein